MIPYLIAAGALIVVAAAAAAIWSGQLPVLRIWTGAQPTGPASKPPPAVTAPLPLDDNPKQHANTARRASRASDMPHQLNRGRSL